MYASETGSAQALAEKLFATLRLHSRGSSCSITIMSIAELCIETLMEDSEESAIVYVMSTTGEGEVVTSMRSLWTKLLRANLPTDFLSDAAPFAIFGLGDSSYEKFNAAARKFRARLIQLGATEFVPNGSGDDQVDTELSFDRWSEDLLSTLVQRFPTVWTAEERPLDPPNAYIVSAPLTTSISTNVFKDVRKGRDMRVVTMKRLSAPGWNQDVRHFEFEDEEVYECGDVLNIWPLIDQNSVTAFLKVKYPSAVGSNTVTISPPHPYLPSIVTIDEIFSKYLDLNAVPSRFFFKQAAHFCSDPEEKEKMLEMASSAPDNAASYTTYCKRERRTYAEVLMDFASCDIPIAALIELMPPLRPRAFSISSSPSIHKGHIHITVALLEYITPWKRKKVGTCSAYLKTFVVDCKTSIRGFITKGSLKLPINPEVPMILIGTGTGCAPMRSIMYERTLQCKKLPSNKIRFYFGCRSSDFDFLYHDEWPSICETLCVAFSQQDKRRVPVLLARDGALLYDLLTNQKAYLYVSGSAKKMPADVRETVTQILMNHGEMQRDHAIKIIRVMERERRYIVEAWS